MIFDCEIHNHYLAKYNRSICFGYNLVYDLEYGVLQSVPITTKVVSSNPVPGEVYSIQHYVIMFVSDIRQVGGFLRVLRFPPKRRNVFLVYRHAVQCLTTFNIILTNGYRYSLQCSIILIEIKLYK
jgi:hypothetical protein